MSHIYLQAEDEIVHIKQLIIFKSYQSQNALSPWQGGTLQQWWWKGADCLGLDGTTTVAPTDGVPTPRNAAIPGRFSRSRASPTSQHLLDAWSLLHTVCHSFETHEYHSRPSCGCAKPEGGKQGWAGTDVPNVSVGTKPLTSRRILKDSVKALFTVPTPFACSSSTSCLKCCSEKTERQRWAAGRDCPWRGGERVTWRARYVGCTVMDQGGERSSGCSLGSAIVLHTATGLHFSACGQWTITGPWNIMQGTKLLENGLSLLHPFRKNKQTNKRTNKKTFLCMWEQQDGEREKQAPTL